MIEVKHICAGYQNKTVIQDVSLSFEPGQIVVLLGPNGSGKSTLLKAALGLIPVRSGDILYDDVPITKMKRKEIAQKAAFLTQSRTAGAIQAFRMVLHGRFPYLSYPRQYSKKDYEIARKCMEVTGCLHLEHKFVNELSGGQQQSVYLAMALAQDTETIFMDEPTTYLDINRQMQLMEIAHDLAARGKAVVLVLHDLALALCGANKIAVFNEGRLQCCDTPQNVCESGILNKVFEVQVYGIDTPHGRKYYYTK